MQSAAAFTNLKLSAAISALAGICLLGYSAQIDSAPLSVTGGCAVLVGVMLVCLVTLLRSICDTTAERQQLQAATRERDSERMRYIASQAALNSERERVRQDLADAQAVLERQLAEERERMEQTFEDKRAALIAEAFEAGVLMERSGALDAKPSGQVIHLPAPAQAPGCERATRPV